MFHWPAQGSPSSASATFPRRGSRPYGLDGAQSLGRRDSPDHGCHLSIQKRVLEPGERSVKGRFSLPIQLHRRLNRRVHLSKDIDIRKKLTQVEQSLLQAKESTK